MTTYIAASYCVIVGYWLLFFFFMFDR